MIREYHLEVFWLVVRDVVIVDVLRSDDPSRPVHGVLEEKILVFLEGEDVGPELDLDLSEEGNLGGQVPREDGGSVSLLVAETGGSATPAEGVISTVRRRSGVKPGVGAPIDKISPAVGRLKVIVCNAGEAYRVGRGRRLEKLLVVLAPSPPGAFALVLFLRAQPGPDLTADGRGIVVGGGLAGEQALGVHVAVGPSQPAAPDSGSGAAAEGVPLGVRGQAVRASTAAVPAWVAAAQGSNPGGGGGSRRRGAGRQGQ